MAKTIIMQVPYLLLPYLTFCVIVQWFVSFFDEVMKTVMKTSYQWPTSLSGTHVKPVQHDAIWNYQG